MVQSSRGGKNGKLNETIEVSALWSINSQTIHCILRDCNVFATIKVLSVML